MFFSLPSCVRALPWLCVSILTPPPPCRCCGWLAWLLATFLDPAPRLAKDPLYYVSFPFGGKDEHFLGLDVRSGSLQTLSPSCVRMQSQILPKSVRAVSIEKLSCSEIGCVPPSASTQTTYKQPPPTCILIALDAGIFPMTDDLNI